MTITYMRVAGAKPGGHKEQTGELKSAVKVPSEQGKQPICPESWTYDPGRHDSQERMAATGAIEPAEPSKREWKKMRPQQNTNASKIGKM